MPLARVGSKLVYFAHVPKCGGMSVEHYMKIRFGTLGLLHNRYGRTPEADRWSRTSPQHMPEADRLTYVPDSFIDVSFAVVRHPALRLRSVFLFQRDVEGRIDAGAEFSSWLNEVADQLDNPFAYDGHLRPMDATVPEQAKVFWLENGLGLLIPWFDDLARDSEEPRDIEPINVLDTRLARLDKPPASLVLTTQDYDRIAQLYATDYDRFGYDILPEH